MRFNRFNPLFSKHEDTPPANAGASTAATETETDGDETQETETEKEPGDEDAPEPAETPAAPEAAAAAPKLTAFERGKLRMLGMGDLIARVEKAEGDTFLAHAEAERLTAANKTLAARIAVLEKETPEKIAAAAKGRENEVSKGVTAQLTALGIAAEAAPSQTTAAEDEAKTKTRAEFDAMKPGEALAFIKGGGKLTD